MDGWQKGGRYQGHNLPVRHISLVLERSHGLHISMDETTATREELASSHPAGTDCWDRLIYQWLVEDVAS